MVDRRRLQRAFVDMLMAQTLFIVLLGTAMSSFQLALSRGPMYVPYLYGPYVSFPDLN